MPIRADLGRSVAGMMKPFVDFMTRLFSLRIGKWFNSLDFSLDEAEEEVVEVEMAADVMMEFREWALPLLIALVLLLLKPDEILEVMLLSDELDFGGLR